MSASSHRVLVVQHEDACPVDRLGDWLQEAGARLEVCRPYAGDRVPAAAPDGLVVLGGHMGAYDDDEAPWLPATRDLLAASAADGTPTLGICLGAQLLAVACGGRVEVGRAGIEAGVVDVAWRPEVAGDPLFGDPLLGEPLAGGTPGTAAPGTSPGPSMHLDAVVELPPGATWLGETPRYPHQAFRVGERAWGVQFHPEASLPTFRGWADHHAHEWSTWGLDGDEVVDAHVRREAELVAAGRCLAQRFASLVG